jgi:uncharacterized protein (DUF1800 family)
MRWTPPVPGHAAADPARRRCMAAWAAGTLAAWLPARQPHAATAAPTDSEALHVLNRLGFGPAPGELAQVMESGTAAYIAAQLQPAHLQLPAALADRLAALQTLHASQAELALRYRSALEAGKDGSDAGKAQQRELFRQVALEAGEARLARAVQSPRQLEEVLVDFWFNHFNVFSGKGLDRMLMASYEREAIRPFVLGRFRDLLGATARHPAMLFYLDNWLSSAPGSRSGGRASGLNENYARELMELHTLGVAGAYTQRDVTELARIFTGWSLRQQAGPDAPEGRIFHFEPRRHDAGPKQWLGHAVDPRGQAEGEWALDVLAAHPATARHVSRKLAQLFVADEPPAALVERLAGHFAKSQGDIAAVLGQLFDSPEFRDPEARAPKFKTPYRYLVSALRAAGQPVANAQPLLAALAQLGMPLYGCATPDGYKNTQAAWLSPDAMTRRLSLATAFATGRLLHPGPAADAGSAVPAEPPPPDATALLAALGPAISRRTRAVVAQFEPGLQAALVLGSPDFMHH